MLYATCGLLHRSPASSTSSSNLIQRARCRHSPTTANTALLDVGKAYGGGDGDSRAASATGDRFAWLLVSATLCAAIDGGLDG